MKSPVVLAAMVMVFCACSTASADWAYGGPVVAPAAVVQSYWPVGPVYAYPAPVVAVGPRVVYRRPVVVPAPVVYPAPVLYPAPVVYPAPLIAPAPVVVRSKVYVRGQPVRNAVRAVLP